MIGISTITQNASGNIILSEKPQSELTNKTARVTRAATLDGGSVITHSGYSDGDLTLRIKAEITEAEKTIINEMFEFESLIHVAAASGFYSGAIERFYANDGNMEMTILIKEKLSA